MQDPTQARQLAAYELLDRRELGEIELPCKPRMRRYGPGDLLNIDLPALGLVNQPAVVLRRSLDPATMGVTLVMRGETLAKHEFALGRTGTPPPTPSLVTTGTRDEAAFPVTLVDMGPWDLATTYREGHVVQDQGSSWVYINTTPSAGNPPPSLPAVSNAYWRVLAKAGEDGKDGVDALPGTPGKDGQTWYPYYAYANSPDGTVDFTTGAPGGRAYVGFATGTSAAEPSIPGVYAWSEYKGPPFGIATRGAAVSAGRQLIKNGGANEWDSDAYSTIGFRGGAVASFKAGQTNGSIMAGLNTDPTTDSSYTSLDYAWYIRDNGKSSIWENGEARADFGYYSTDTQYQVSYDGTSVAYYLDGIEARRINHGANALFYFDSSFSTPDGRLYDIDFVARGSNGRDGLDGTDGIDGTNGQTIHIAYADSSDGTVNFTTGAAGGRTYIGVYTDTNPGADSTNPASYGWTRLRGIDGTNGLAGPGGYVHIAYADSADGAVNFHLSDPTGRRYLGTYTDQTEPDSTDPSRYAWSLVRGADGSDGVSPIAVTLQPNAVTFQAYANGSPYAGQFPYNVGVSATRAGTIVPVTSVAIVSTNGMTVATGPLRITSMTSSDGYAVLDVTAAGQTVRVQLGASIVREGSDGSVATRLAINSPQLTWTDFTQHGNAIGINASPSGKLTVNLSGQMTGDPAADYVLRFVSKVQYRPAGGSWIDVPGSQVTSTEGGISTIGDGAGGGTRIVRANVNGTGPYAITGLTADGSYEVRAMTYRLTQFGSSAVGLSLYAERTA
ncbi:hypothetical protein [Sphingomonas phyllosphaerae]|uniref:hypothetical protein n=1 Tax=Sphingomonas phyllosphaerae TaxID=257003 RepID=UPI002FF49338